MILKILKQLPYNCHTYIQFCCTVKWILVFCSLKIKQSHFSCYNNGYSRCGGIRQGDHFLPHKLIKRSFECWANSTKQLLNAGREHQAPGKTAIVFERKSPLSPPPPSLLYPTLWISLDIPGCGEHLRNWLLARYVSLLFTLPLLLLVPSISFLPLLFSM